MLHLLAGIVIIILLGIHMGIMHLESILVALGTGYERALSWASVAARNKQLFFTVTYVVLLGTALYHGFYGLRNILFELNLGGRAETAISWILVCAGAGLFVFGTYAAVAAYTM
jgi:succinate dehydrogenase / fumarate reductase membrane anchor subunit